MSEIANNNNEIKLIPIDEIVPNPKNRNSHPEKQIKRLAKILKYQGWRAPLIVSNQSGNLVAGHGRYMAARELGLKVVPVMYQDFDSPEQEYAHGVADNAIASWAELDLSNIHLDLPQLDASFMELDMLGIEKFQLEPTKPHKEKVCPNCGEPI